MFKYLLGLILPYQIHQLFPRTTFSKTSAHSQISLQVISESFPYLQQSQIFKNFQILPKFPDASLKLASLDQFLDSGENLKNYMILYNSETCMSMVVKENNFHMLLAEKLSHLLFED